MRTLILLIITVVSIAIAKPPSVSIAVPVESWERCKTEWSKRNMDATLGKHPRMLTPSEDTVVVATHRWTPSDLMRIAALRSHYGWPVVASRDTLTVVTDIKQAP